MMFRILALLLLPIICLAQINLNGQKPASELLTNEISPNEMKRNASFNLEEIKVRWKKAALENCTGVPCASFTVPGPVTSIVATPTGPTSVRVSFATPSSDGGSPITGYRATATSTSGAAPAKRKSSATITVEGPSSPIDIPGLISGVNYIFTVEAINAAGGSAPTVTVIPVTPCTLNTATASTEPPQISLGQPIFTQEPITIATTTGATGIGTATGLPKGMTAIWLNNSIMLSGAPTEANTFNYTIPLTGGCGSVNATGTISVTDCKLLVVEQSFPPELTIYTNTTIPTILIPTTKATGLVLNFIPNGLSASLGSNGIITISGKPELEVGDIPLEITVEGACDKKFFILIIIKIVP
jgi:hypothetical protein